MDARKTDAKQGRLRAVRGRGIPIVYHPDGNHRDRAGEAMRRPPKASEEVAAAIVQHIVAKGLTVGDLLPSESEMLAAYDLSRESLREGLRILEVQGLIVIKRGPFGGPVVAPLNAAYLARTAALYFNLAGASYDEVFETWQEIEPPLAERLAATCDRKTRREAFGPFCEGPGPRDSFDQLNGFHALIANLSGNRVLTLLTQAVSHIVVDHVLAAQEVGARTPPDELPELQYDHEVIAQAIADGRGRKARTLMHDHIVGVTEYYRARWPEQMRAPIEWR